MSAGAIDHEAGTRHIHRLGGPRDADADHRDAVVRRRGGDGRNPAVERLSVEGDDAGGGVAHGLSRAATGCFRCWRPLAALLSAAYSFRFAIGTFLGPARHDYPHHPHDPPAGLWLPIAVLVLPIVAIGIAPQTVAGPIVEPTARAVVGGAPPPFEPALWHGFTDSGGDERDRAGRRRAAVCGLRPGERAAAGRAQAGSKRYLRRRDRERRCRRPPADRLSSTTARSRAMSGSCSSRSSPLAPPASPGAPTRPGPARRCRRACPAWPPGSRWSRLPRRWLSGTATGCFRWC